MSRFENVGVFIRERFGSKIAGANRKEGDRVEVGPSRETGCGG
jgi:hypothetical protein